MDDQTFSDTGSATAPRRLTRLERVRRTTDLSVGQLSLRELHQELQRRVRQLQDQKRELLDKIEEINRELENIGDVGVEAPGEDPVDRINGRRPRRARNDVPLADLLAQLLADTAMTTRDAAEAALAAGYRTTSKNFVNSVGVALHRDERFTKADGKWLLAEADD